MSFNAITQLLENGISEEELLASLVKSLPKLGKKASKLLAGGWDVKNVLNVFSKDKEVQKSVRKEFKPTTPKEIAAMRLRDSYQNIPQNQNEQSREELQNFTKKAAPIGLAIAVPFVARAAAPLAESAIQRVLPNSLKGMAGQKQVQSGINQAVTQSAPSLTHGKEIADQQAPISHPQTSQPPISPNPNTNPQTTPSQGIPNTSPIKGSANINEIMTSIVSNNPNISGDEMAGIIKKLYPDIAKKIEQGNKKTLKEVMDNVIPVLKQKIQPNAQTTQNQAQEQPNLESSSTQLDATQEKGNAIIPESKADLHKEAESIEHPKKIEKSSIVSTPHGEGEVKSIKEKNAIVEVDGKLHKVPIEELEPPKFTDDEIADAYDNLMEKIPEEHRSGFISWAGYDEDRNVLGFIPRGGKYEELHNITPEEAELVKTGKGVARTNGEEREGLWVVGEDTRGGIISQIIHDRRKKNKSEEEKQLKFDLDLPKPEKQDRGMKPIFDEMKHARDLSRERDRKKAIEERQRKKKEKDEAKKRKK